MVAIPWRFVGILLKYFLIIAIKALNFFSFYFTEDEEELFTAIQHAEVHYPSTMSDKATQCIKLFLQRDPEKRLGLDTCPYGLVRQHQFFSTIDWNKVENRQMKPPFKPSVVSYINLKKKQ